MNELKEKADSRYTLVILTAKRARDIIAHKPVLTDFEVDRPVSLAAHEIAEDLITYKRVEKPAEPEEETVEEASAEATEEAAPAEDVAEDAPAENVEEDAPAEAVEA